MINNLFQLSNITWNILLLTTMISSIIITAIWYFRSLSIFETIVTIISTIIPIFLSIIRIVTENIIVIKLY